MQFLSRRNNQNDEVDEFRFKLADQELFAILRIMLM